ncbi:MAG: hypothetical protein JWM87_2502 [Candidatus Eremiobacteraeota bacterium]|nr:hypothetical protein [Candidatus Eremiobacteraeota bacterium]
MDRVDDVSHLAAVARRLSQTFKPERIAAIVRQPSAALAGKNVLQTLAEPDGVARVMDALDQGGSFGDGK